MRGIPDLRLEARHTGRACRAPPLRVSLPFRLEGLPSVSPLSPWTDAHPSSPASRRCRIASAAAHPHQDRPAVQIGLYRTGLAYPAQPSPNQPPHTQHTQPWARVRGGVPTPLPLRQRLGETPANLGPVAKRRGRPCVSEGALHRRSPPLPTPAVSPTAGSVACVFSYGCGLGWRMCI